MLPKLFPFRYPVVAVDRASLGFATPLGRLELTLEVAGRVVPPEATFAAGERSVAVWAAPVAFELLRTHPLILLPPGMAIDGAAAAVWRAGLTPWPGPIIIRCVWTAGASWSDGGPESGENLDALTWTDGSTKVSVGLPDFGGATTYRRDGFEVAVGMVAGHQGHFVCAWGPDSPDDVSTWFAVDCSPVHLVAPDAVPGTSQGGQSSSG